MTYDGVVSTRGDPRIHAYGVTLEAIARLNRLFDKSLRERCGITQSWFEALLRLECSDGRTTMGELAEDIVLTSGGVTRLVDRLAEEGLAERRSCPEDRRVQYVAITEEGRTRLADAVGVYLGDLEESFLGLMSEAERETLVATMERLRDSTRRAVTLPAH